MPASANIPARAKRALECGREAAALQFNYLQYLNPQSGCVLPAIPKDVSGEIVVAAFQSAFGAFRALLKSAKQSQSAKKGKSMLRIASQENAGTICLKLEGRLKGAWVPEMEQCWRKAASNRNKTLVVDLTDVEFVDTAGRYLLALMRAQGASFIAATPLMTELVAELAESDPPKPAH